MSTEPGERMLDINGVQLCVQTFGDPASVPVLLMHGACASMIWWEEPLCRQVAAHGRYVIRFDWRDTGRSTAYPPGQPGYAMRDLAQDAVGILDALGIERAHVVGQSMAGGLALILGVDHPGRVASLTFVGTTTGEEGLPRMSEEFMQYTNRQPVLGGPRAVVEFIVGMMRVFSGGSRYFDEPRMRRLAQEDVLRTRNMASALVNHFAMQIDGPRGGGFADLCAPCLIVHGERDPVYPLPHAHALERAMPGSRLLVLPQAGHEIPEPLWGLFIEALIRHTGQVSSAG